MRLPFFDKDERPAYRGSFFAAALVAATLITHPSFSFSDEDENDSEEISASTTELPISTIEPGSTFNKTDSEDPGKDVSLRFGGGATQHLPTEYYQISEEYGMAIYRRYFPHDKQNQPTGEIIQEYYVNKPMLLQEAPGLNFSKPEGLQFLGLVAIKKLLKGMILDHSACMNKPFYSQPASKYWVESQDPGEILEWGQTLTENDRMKNNCGMSLRLTTTPKGARRVKMKGRLCRYPAQKREFNSSRDDGECIDILDVTQTRANIPLLSAQHDRKRMETSVLNIAAKMYNDGLGTITLSSKKTPPVNMGVVGEMFGLYLPSLNSASSTGYKWALDSDYVHTVASAHYKETLEAIEIEDGANPQAFILSQTEVGESFDQMLAKKSQQARDINYKDAGIRLTTSKLTMDMDDFDDDDQPVHPVVLTFKVESDKSLTFTDHTMQALELTDKDTMDGILRSNYSIEETENELALCHQELNDCEALKLKLTHLEQENEARQLKVTDAAQQRDDDQRLSQARLTALENALETKTGAAESTALQLLKNVHNEEKLQEKQKTQQAADELNETHQQKLKGLKNDFFEEERKRRVAESDKTESQLEVTQLTKQVKREKQKAADAEEQGKKATDSVRSYYETEHAKLTARNEALERKITELENSLRTRDAAYTRQLADLVEMANTHDANLWTFIKDKNNYDLNP